MTAYLICWKSAEENKAKGWPTEKLAALAKRVNESGEAIEPWRFSRRKGVRIGERVFLLRQGRLGPGILGYGTVAALPAADQTRTTIRFQVLVDPTHDEVLATSSELRKITSTNGVWNTNSSGIALKQEVASALEKLVVNAMEPHWKKVNRESIFAAIAEFEDIGRDKFLSEYDFGKSKAYFLNHNNRLYDCKPILWAAQKHQFGRMMEKRHTSGVDKLLRPFVEKLGFLVVGSKERKLDAEAFKFTNIWRLTSHHEEPDKAVAWIRQAGRIAIGWGEIGDIRKVKPESASEIGALIRGAYPSLGNSHRGGPSLWNLYNNARVHDLVIVDRAMVVEITGEYVFASEMDSFGNYQHQRAVVETNWNAEDLWAIVGRDFAEGQSSHWALALCSEKSALVEPNVKKFYSEGSLYEVTSQGKERNPAARLACLRHHGYACFVCKFDFFTIYGELGYEFIHVHHRNPLRDAEGEREVDPEQDMVPLCPNCHAMVHRQVPLLSPEELKEIVFAKAAKERHVNRITAESEDEQIRPT